MELKEKALEYLKNNTSIKQVFATQDGFLFLEKKDAQNHAQTLEDKRVYTFDNKGEQYEKPFDFLNGDITQIAQQTASIEDIELLEELILQEESGANRQDVLRMLAKRIEKRKKQK